MNSDQAEAPQAEGSRGTAQGKPRTGVEVARFWDEMAARYDRGFNSRRGRFTRARQAAVVRLLGDGPGELLDAGMGGGRLLAELASRGWTVTGVDLSPEMVELARRRLPAAQARLIAGEIEALPFAEESFDAVVVTGVLEYVGYRARAVAEVERVLRPGGRAVISIPLHRLPLRLWRHTVLYPMVRRIKRLVPLGRPERPPGPPPPQPPSFERLVEEAGLSVASRHYVTPSSVLPPSPVAGVASPAGGAPEATGSARWLRETQVVFALRKPAQSV